MFICRLHELALIYEQSPTFMEYLINERLILLMADSSSSLLNSNAVSPMPCDWFKIGIFPYFLCKISDLASRTVAFA